MTISSIQSNHFRNRIFCLLPILIFFGLLNINSPAFSQINDHIFPPADAAKKFISFDAKGFLLNGKRTFLVSAGMEYARIPHELWYDRLLRLKRGGFNCVEVYTFWNFHEPFEGKFDFAGDRDLENFLKICKQLDLYAIVRVGPYYCGEWDSGGYPIWLRFKDNLQVRSPNAPFEKYMDRFLDHLMPIVSRQQIHLGGPVILVQLENEHPLSWGTNIPNTYFKHLQEKALALGLQVPYFFSGLNHGGDPAGNKVSLDDPKRPSPWFTTEFWSVWYDRYGSTKADADTFGRRTWKIIARGGNGYNYYMAHGGTNFDYSFSHEDAACYDYGAAVGQTGDLRPIYYQFKRNGLFARSFEQILENSTAGQVQQLKGIGSSYTINSRISTAGTISFIDNYGKGILPYSGQGLVGAKGNFTINLEPGEILPVVQNFNLTDKVTLLGAYTRVLGIARNGKTTTLVVYGRPGSQGSLSLRITGQTKSVGHLKHLSNGKLHNLQLSYGKDAPLVQDLITGGQTLRILALSTELADRSWFVEEKKQQFVVVGPEYVADFHISTNQAITLNTEYFWKENKKFPVWVFGDQLKKHIVPSRNLISRPNAVLNNNWLAKSASAAALPDFDDREWLASDKPLEMGADKDISANAWYRTHIKIQKSGRYKLNISSGVGRYIVFVDGKRVTAGYSDQLQFDVETGDHMLAIYAAHDGRDKLYNFIGYLSEVDKKGIAGEVIMHRGAPGLVDNWKMVKLAGERHDENQPVPDFTNAESYKIGADPFGQKAGFAWFQAIIPIKDGRVPTEFRFRSVDDKAVVFINGKPVARADDWNKPFTAVYQDDGTNKPIVLSVFLENHYGAGGIDKPVEIIYNDDLKLKGWKMKGGPGDMLSADGWSVIGSTEKFNRPYFYKNTFRLEKTKPNNHPMWRISFEGLSHGFIFINGHNIGGYPERVPINGLYIPECWLKAGDNTVIIYDQYGNRPDAVRITPESAASRETATIRIK
ncbi:hypothetical protein CA265_02545 [Sphingobacteriaceae bacterium GW460-11-11-14-LB5]|nr:hypothetical protein CA265_02545 [Sphingobacteriaceae bacterium GW460-11-11-14-LB5]